MIVSDLAKYGGSKKLINTLSTLGLKELYPPQALAVKAGLLKRRGSFVVAAPTASGKTLVAEMAALQAFETGGKVIYLVPLRALAREKYDDFSKKYKGIGINVMQSTGDYDSADPWLYNADLIISTNEKMDSLIRHRASWLKDVSLVVADEIHLIGDHHRGPTLEIVLTRMRWLNPELRLIALSAAIPNAAEISRWLDARLIESDWRPVPLREGVFFNEAVIFNDGTVKWIPGESIMDVEKPLSILRVRVLYGIKEELLQLVALRGIGRVRARNLYNAGFKTLKNIKDAAIDDLEKVPTIGRTIAEDIKKQVAVQEVGCLITLK